MKVGIIIETKTFLMSAGVEIESIDHEKYNAKKQIDEFVRNKGTVLACGICIQARGQDATEVCPISYMSDCVDMVEWADRAVTF